MIELDLPLLIGGSGLGWVADRLGAGGWGEEHLWPCMPAKLACLA